MPYGLVCCVPGAIWSGVRVLPIDKLVSRHVRLAGWQASGCQSPAHSLSIEPTIYLFQAAVRNRDRTIFLLMGVQLGHIYIIGGGMEVFRY